MSNYKHILIADDFSKGITKIRNRALEMAKRHKALVSVCHVIEPVSDYTRALVPGFEEDLLKTIHQKLEKTYQKFDIPAKQLFVREGRAKTVLPEIARQKKIDLIVMGSHGEHGVVEYLLGSTATGVLHSASCDVLVVRV